MRRSRARRVGTLSTCVISGVKVMGYMMMRIDCGMGRKWLIGGAIAWFLASIPAALAQSTEFNPAYPRIAARPHGTLLGSSLSVVDADSRHIAMHQVAILATDRTWKGGGFDMATLPALIKSYNPNVKLFKYMNANQLDDDAPDWIRDKLYSERGGGGKGDWWKRTSSGNKSRDSAQASIRSMTPCRRRLTRAVCNGRNGSSGTGMPRRRFRQLGRSCGLSQG